MEYCTACSNQPRPTTSDRDVGIDSSCRVEVDIIRLKVFDKICLGKRHDFLSELFHESVIHTIGFMDGLDKFGVGVAKIKDDIVVQPNSFFRATRCPDAL
jgi:hypothetical protein